MKVQTSKEPIVGCAGDVLVAPVYAGGRLPAVTLELAGRTGVDFAAIGSRFALQHPGDRCRVPAGEFLACPDVLLVCVGEHSAGGVRADDRES